MLDILNGIEEDEKIRVLYLDDEPNNLICFMATFRFDFTIYIAQTVQKAYEYLKEVPNISIIIADQRMPVQTGIEFFEELRELYPQPVRMLVTAYSDMETVIGAINIGSIFRYIKKPWNDEEIKAAVHEGYKYYISTAILADKNKQLSNAYKELGKFAYSVTHDLRGPLQSLLGALQIAKDMDTVEEMNDIFGLMESSVNKLDEFVKNIHEYYTIRQGNPKFESIDFNLLAKDMEQMFLITCKLEKIRFTYTVVQNSPFYTDIVSLKIIINNLLSNAFKYQRKNETDKFVTLTIDVADGKVVILVQDNGIGIHAEYIDRIFTMFYRATSEQSGSGFGLYNVKDALSKIKGEIEVASKINIGTTFKVIIPGQANDTE